MKLFLSLVLLGTIAFARPVGELKNFSQAKNIARMVYLDDKRSYFYGCSYHYDKTKCLHVTVVDSCVKSDATTVLFKRLIPSKVFGKNRKCMQEKICTSMKGVAYSGERCCRKVDSFYQKMEADLFNIVPVIDSYDGYVPDDRRGDVARVYLYYNAHYGVALSEKALLKYYRWHKIDPVDARECGIYKTIKKLQPHTNRYLESVCH